jgi:hypothetical protein
LHPVVLLAQRFQILLTRVHIHISRVAHRAPVLGNVFISFVSAEPF